jgi:glycerol-3-phosphate dehydrogenase
MAEQTADEVCRKLGVSAPSTTADEVLPGQGDGAHYWLGHRLADHEDEGGGDVDLICECEMLTRSHVEAFLDERWPCSLDDVRRGTRLGMGPCQGGFCTFRAAGLVAERIAAGTGAAPATGTAAGDGSGAAATAAVADRALFDFLAERHRGTRPIAWGRQLQELWFTMGIYQGVLGSRSLAAMDGGAVGPAPAEPAAEGPALVEAERGVR